MAGAASPPKLILAVIDGLTPSELERAVAAGRAPILGALMERGTYVSDCVAAFPSVTPVCAATIATGRLQDEHRIPSMNWWSRAEGRYVEYGSSFAASRRFGFQQQLADTVYNMNAEHLSADVRTVFEVLDDADVRTAGTTYLMYRGRHPHEPSREFAVSRVIGATLFRRTVMGPRELFYADLFASRRTGCWSQMGSPGLRDQHAGCVGAHLVEHDLFDFLLLSLPDNDTASHKAGLEAQVAAIAHADRQLERIAHAAGGLDRFLERHAIVVLADHAHSRVEHEIALADAFADWAVRGPGRSGARDAELALCPSQRAAMVYVLVEEARQDSLPRLVETARELDGVDLVMWREDGRAVIAGAHGELRFAPARGGQRGAVVDARGARWVVRGDLGAVGARVDEGVLRSDDYPDALARVWAALACPTSGDVLLSAAPAWEFPDWGGTSHVGGGSHGSLHAGDSHGALLFAGVQPPPERSRDGAWSIRDVAPMAARHFDAL